MPLRSGKTTNLDIQQADGGIKRARSQSLQSQSVVMKASLVTPSLAVLPSATRAFAVPGKLGLGLLVALFVGSILGSGIFGVPQNIAAGAVARVSFGWLALPLLATLIEQMVRPSWWTRAGLAQPASLSPFPN